MFTLDKNNKGAALFVAVIVVVMVMAFSATYIELTKSQEVQSFSLRWVNT